MTSIQERIEAVSRELVIEKDFVPLEKAIPASGSAAGLFEASVARVDAQGVQVLVFLAWHGQEATELEWRADSLRQGLTPAAPFIQGRVIATLLVVCESAEAMKAAELACRGIKEGHFLEKILVGHAVLDMSRGQLSHVGREKPQPGLDWLEERFVSRSAPSREVAEAIIERKMGEERQSRRLLSRRDSWATWSLIILNVMAFVVEIYYANLYDQSLGNGQDSENSLGLALQHLGMNQGQLVFGEHQWWRLLSCLFLHAGALHLLLNMVSLFSIGGLVERFGGTWRFLVLYFASGLMASLASALLSGNQNSVGASGAIMGLAGALMALRWRRPKDFPVALAERIFRMLLFPVLATFFIGFGLQLLNGPLRFDNYAHLGGVLTGFALVLLWPGFLQKDMRQKSLL